MPFLDLEEHKREVAELARESGPPLLRRARVGDAAYWASETRTRLAEVCMVVRRPSGRLLIATKTFYPPGVYRLLTGGVDPGESVVAALRRELAEETGLEVVIRRLLAVITYYATGAEAGTDDPARFATFAFLLDEQGGTLGATDPHEQISDFREIAPNALPAIATQLDRLPDTYSEELDDTWGAWGRFRAVVHRAVWDALAAAAEASKGGGPWPAPTS